jgi:hypothetical protein
MNRILNVGIGMDGPDNLDIFALRNSGDGRTDARKPCAEALSAMRRDYEEALTVLDGKPRSLQKSLFERSAHR